MATSLKKAKRKEKKALAKQGEVTCCCGLIPSFPYCCYSQKERIKMRKQKDREALFDADVGMNDLSESSSEAEDVNMLRLSQQHKQIDVIYQQIQPWQLNIHRWIEYFEPHADEEHL